MQNIAKTAYFFLEIHVVSLENYSQKIAKILMPNY